MLTFGRVLRARVQYEVHIVSVGSYSLVFGFDS